MILSSLEIKKKIEDHQIEKSCRSSAIFSVASAQEEALMVKEGTLNRFI